MKTALQERECRRRPALALFLACVGFWGTVNIAAPLNAETNSPSELNNVKNFPGETNSDEARRVAMRMAVCSVKRAPSRGRALLETSIGSAEESQAMETLLLGMFNCIRQLPPLVKIDMDVGRGLIAEALFEEEFSSGINRLPIQEKVRAYRLRDQASMQVSIRIGWKWMAACAVASDFQRVQNLLATEVTTLEENNALRALMPAMSSCVQQGISLELPPEALRSLLAEELYRYAVVQRDGKASPWAARDDENGEVAE